MKKVGLAILGLILFAVIIIMVVVEIIEFTIGAILFLVALLILWGIWRWLKSKIND